MTVRPRLDPTHLAPGVADEINKAYYSKVVEAPERARTRALNGFTVASALAAAVVAAGLARGLDRWTTAQVVVGCAAVAFWLGAGAAYLTAVAGWRRAGPERPAAITADEAALRRLGDATADVAAVRKVATIAHGLSLVALAATLLLVLLAAFGGPARDRVVLLLDAAGARALAALCDRGPGAGGRPAPIPAELDPHALGAPFVAVRVDAGACRGRAADVRLPSADIRAVGR